ncbi:MAG: hypothetical protein FD162_2148 [Rhodobacteraceae bacterium]|nr:MAG: hypothetical protein FD162_2148 [Paracoccaceae bacterium]
MQIRNPVFTADGRIDVEVNFPSWGWLAFTADPSDVEAQGREIFAAALEMGPAPYTPPAEDAGAA